MTDNQLFTLTIAACASYSLGVLLMILYQADHDRYDPGRVLLWPLWMLAGFVRIMWIKPTLRVLKRIGYEFIRPFKASRPS
jgi:hypothetical protein